MNQRNFLARAAAAVAGLFVASKLPAATRPLLELREPGVPFPLDVVRPDDEIFERVCWSALLPSGQRMTYWDSVLFDDIHTGDVVRHARYPDHIWRVNHWAEDPGMTYPDGSPMRYFTGDPFPGKDGEAAWRKFTEELCSKMVAGRDYYKIEWPIEPRRKMLGTRVSEILRDKG